MNEPSALAAPTTASSNALIVIGNPGSNPCPPIVVTVIKLAPIPLVPADASVVTVAT